MARAALTIPSKYPLSMEQEPKTPPLSDKPDYRAGRTQFGGWIGQEAKRQLDIWAAQNGKTRQWVLEEALNLFFEREGLPRLARLKED